MNTLELLRDQLNTIDHQIVVLLNERMKIAEATAICKDQMGLALKDPDREKRIIECAQGKAESPILKEHIENIFSSIMEAAKEMRLMNRGNPPYKCIGIIGIGLIGGSLAKALKIKKRAVQIAAIEDGTDDYRLAKTAGIIDLPCMTLQELMQKSDLIILACPISVVCGLANQIKDLSISMHKKLVVMDVASVKKEIYSHFELLSNRQIEFIATHPMAGSEKSGFTHSRGLLFRDAPWIICPHSRNEPKTIEQIERFIEYVGAKSVIREADVHDKQTALISHMPGILSNMLLQHVHETDEMSLAIAGGGFKSMTRLAHSNPQLRQEIEKANRENIQECLARFCKKIKEMRCV